MDLVRREHVFPRHRTKKILRLDCSSTRVATESSRRPPTVEQDALTAVPGEGQGINRKRRSDPSAIPSRHRKLRSAGTTNPKTFGGAPELCDLNFSSGSHKFRGRLTANRPKEPLDNRGTGRAAAAIHRRGPGTAVLHGRTKFGASRESTKENASRALFEDRRQFQKKVFVALSRHQRCRQLPFKSLTDRDEFGAINRFHTKYARPKNFFGEA